MKECEKRELKNMILTDEMVSLIEGKLIGLKMSKKQKSDIYQMFAHDMIRDADIPTSDDN